MEPELRSVLRERLMQDIRAACGIWFVIVAACVTLAYTASTTAATWVRFPVGNFALAIAGVTFAGCALHCTKRASRRRLEALAASSLVRSHRARVAAEADWMYDRRR